MGFLNRRDALKLAAVGATSLSAFSTVAAQDTGAANATVASFDGDWVFRSYLINPGPIGGKNSVGLEWAPVGDINLTTKSDGKVTGKMKFRGSGIELTIQGKVIPAFEQEIEAHGTDDIAQKITTPVAIELIAKGSKALLMGKVVYDIRGWVVPKSPIDPEVYQYDAMQRSLLPVDDSKAKPNVRGIVTNHGPDLRGAAIGSVGAFVLIPKV